MTPGSGLRDTVQLGRAWRSAPERVLGLISRMFQSGTPPDSPLTLATVKSSAKYRDLSMPKLAVGDTAFDFELPQLEVTDGVPRTTVRLSAFRNEQPVVLIFGSYTCLKFRGRLRALEKLHRRYGDQVAFFVVYIAEAHPEDGWVMRANRHTRLKVFDPTTHAQREEIARTCALRKRLRIPLIVDTIDNAVASAYGGWPSRLYLIGRNGRVAYQGGPGPFDAKPGDFGLDTSELEAVIRAEIGSYSPQEKSYVEGTSISRSA